MADKEALKKKLQARNGHRLVARKTIGKAKDLLPPFDQETPLELKPKLETLKNTLEKKRTEIAALDDEITNLLEEAAIEKEIVDRSEFEEETEETLCRIALALKERAVHHQPVSHQTQRENVFEKVKLPKLTLSSFNGDPAQWISFWDSFASTIHSNSSLAEIDKFKYLQQSLRGAATQTISGLPLTGDNYTEAIELLQKRYGNRQVIVSRHMDVLRDLPKIENSSDLQGLRQLYDKTESTVRSLRGMKVSTESYATVLTPNIMSKIPLELRLLISRKLTNDWDLEGLLEHLGEELALREKCAFSSSSAVSGASGTTTKYRQREFTQPSTTATLMVKNQQQGWRNYSGIPLCLFCGNQHYSSICSVVTNPNTRKKMLQEKKRCFVCLRGGHISRNCTSSSRCFRCQGRHHVAICGSLANNSRQPQYTQPQGITQHP